MLFANLSEAEIFDHDEVWQILTNAHDGLATKAENEYLSLKDIFDAVRRECRKTTEDALGNALKDLV